MARFFIDRPIFAIVLAILISLAGALSIATLPIEQYPDHRTARRAGVRRSTPALPPPRSKAPLSR